MTVATLQGIQFLNLAYFGRPADPASLSAWPASGLSLEAIVLQFTGTAEYATNTVEPNSAVNPGGGRTFNDTNLINTFYQRLFGRLATSAEVAGWADALARGAVNYDYLGITILQAGLNLPTGTEMREVLIAKFDSNQLYTGILFNNPVDAAAYSTAAAIQDGIAFSSATTTTTPQTFAQAQTAVNQMVVDSGAGGGQTFTLTTGVDTIPGMIGSNGTSSTAGNDVVNGILSDVAASNTLNTFDNLNLGQGSNVLNVRIAGLGADATTAPLLRNIQLINSSNSSTANRGIIDLASATGTTAVGMVNNVVGSLTTFLNIAAGSSLALDNSDANVAGSQAFNVQGAADRTGTSDAITLRFLNGSGTAANAADLAIVTAAGAGNADATFEVGNVTVGGAASYVSFGANGGGANFRTFTVTGATTADANGFGLTLTENANFAQLRTVNASAMTGGGINIATTGQQNLTFTGSAANDRLNITGGIANINNLDVIDFGTGTTNTLALGNDTNIAGYTAAQNALINAITTANVLEFTAASPAGGSTLNASNFTTINSFVYSGATGGAISTADQFTLTGVASTDTFTWSANAASNAVAAAGGNNAAGGAGNDVVDLTGAVVGTTANLILNGAGVTLTGQTGGAGSIGANAADASAARGGAGGAGGQVVDFTGSVSTLVIASTGTAANTLQGGTGGAAAAGGASTAGGAVGGLGGNGGAGGVAIDNGAAVQNVTINGNQNLTIAGGAGGAAGAGGAGNGAGATGAAGTAGTTAAGFSGAVNVNASALTGNLTITASTANDIVTGGTGDDTITGAAGVDLLTGGTGADRFIQTVGQAATGILATAITFANGVDRVTDFTAAQTDVLQGDGTGLTSTTIQSTNAIAAGTYLIQGTFANNVFTINNTGVDLLYATVGAAGGVINAVNNNAMVLSGGFTGFNVNSNFVA